MATASHPDEQQPPQHTHDETALLQRLDAERIVELSAQELARLLEVADLRTEEPTGLAGAIRVIALDGRIFVQEQAERGELLLRRMADLDAARRFVAERLAAYERMWDG